MLRTLPFKHQLWLSFVVLMMHLSAKAQYEENNFVRYTTKEGLSDNYVTALQQDQQGYVWVGTIAGLNSFNGFAFSNYHPSSTVVPLLSGKIVRLKTFPSGKLGIISRNGFQLLNTKTFALKNYIIPDTTSFANYKNNMWDAYLLSNGSSYVSTSAGFYTFTATGSTDFMHEAYKIEDVPNKSIRYGKDIFKLNDRDFLVYLEMDKLAIYNSQKKLFREIDPSEKEWKIFFRSGYTTNDSWITKFQLNSNEYIFTSRLKDSIVFYNHLTKKKITSPLPVNYSKEWTWESRITMINDSSFVINGGFTGFFYLTINRQTGTIKCIKKKFFSSEKITTLFIDKDHRLWAGTSTGLLKQKLNSPYLKTFSCDPKLLDDETLGSFTTAFSYKGKLYAARYSNKTGLVILDTATMQPEKMIGFYEKNSMWNEVLSIQMYHPDTLWLATNAGILWFDIKSHRYGKVHNGIPHDPLNAHFIYLSPARKDGFAWLHYNLKGIVCRYNLQTREFTTYSSSTKPALPFYKIKHIVYDSYGDVWIGGHSLTRWNNRKQLFDTLIITYGGFKKFNDDILTLSADENGSLWFHNEENGLLEYVIQEKKYNSYTVKNGLQSDAFASFSPVINNKLWMASNNNLICFDTRTKKAIVYGHTDGLPYSRTTSRRIYYDSLSRNFYLLFKNDLVRFSAEPPSIAATSNELVVQSISINNQQTIFHPEEEIRLSYIENNIDIKFNTIDYEAADDYKFAYRLDAEKEWITLDKQRNLMLTGLPAGKYVVQLKSNGKGSIEKTAQVAFIISPPFWKTSLFILAVNFLLVAVIYLLYRYRIKKIKQKAQLDKLLSQTEMKALHAQMNPHFIFNSLNSIKEMVLTNENKEASHYLSKFARLIRITLDQSGQLFITLRDTIDYLERYIEMEKIRNSHFTYSIVTDEHLDAEETILPPMLIQPFIENSIWHGVTGARKDINIQISFKKEMNQLVCTIEDDGVGIHHSLKNKSADPQPNLSVGISNIKNRIQLLNEKYKLKCSVTIEDKMEIAGSTESGTLVSLRLPLELKNA